MASSVNEPAPEPAPEAIPRMPFDHEKLDVYGLAVDFVSRAKDVVEALPRGRGYLADSGDDDLDAGLGRGLGRSRDPQHVLTKLIRADQGS